MTDDNDDNMHCECFCVHLICFCQTILEAMYYALLIFWGGGRLKQSFHAVPAHSHTVEVCEIVAVHKTEDGDHGDAQTMTRQKKTELLCPYAFTGTKFMETTSPFLQCYFKTPKLLLSF